MIQGNTAKPLITVVGAASKQGRSVAEALLDSGRYDGKVLVQKTTFMEIVHPQTMVPEAEFYPTARLTRPRSNSSCSIGAAVPPCGRLARRQTSSSTARG